MSEPKNKARIALGGLDIYISGTHQVSSGFVNASGSATVNAYDSATVNPTERLSEAVIVIDRRGSKPVIRTAEGQQR